LVVVEQIRQRTMELGRDIPIEVDGGIGRDTARLAAAAGASLFVSGSSNFRSKAYGSAIAALRDSIQ
jgi:ribulose-phosphate 3-epimerase